eukprot:Skav222006  [mRNA]  locus=scaffold2020:134919:144157:- [translate_table: standard]
MLWDGDSCHLALRVWGCWWCYGRHAPTVAAPPPFKSKASASRVIPDAIVNDADLNAAIAAVLPRTHDFEARLCWREESHSHDMR